MLMPKEQMKKRKIFIYGKNNSKNPIKSTEFKKHNETRIKIEKFN